MSEGSDIEIKSALPKKSSKRKIPSSPTENLLVEKKAVKKAQKEAEAQKEDGKKLTTKIMISQALAELKSRKGTSLQAIKKYLKENYNVDTEKNNYRIKTSIKKAVEEGTILQTKGTGATGSFKLVPGKTQTNKNPAQKIPNTESDDKKTKTKSEKVKTQQKKSSEKVKKSNLKENKPENKLKTKKAEKVVKMKVDDEKTGASVKKKNVKKITKPTRTPLKKKSAMMKRKSIGSIIKAPKMKPKAKG